MTYKVKLCSWVIWMLFNLVKYKQPRLHFQARIIALSRKISGPKNWIFVFFLYWELKGSLYVLGVLMSDWLWLGSCLSDTHVNGAMMVADINCNTHQHWYHHMSWEFVKNTINIGDKMACWCKMLISWSSARQVFPWVL